MNLSFGEYNLAVKNLFNSIFTRLELEDKVRLMKQIDSFENIIKIYENNLCSFDATQLFLYFMLSSSTIAKQVGMEIINKEVTDLKKMVYNLDQCINEIDERITENDSKRYDLAQIGIEILKSI